MVKREHGPVRGVSERGHALLLALFVIVLTMAASVLLAGSLSYRMGLLREEVQDVHLTALSDAGVALALDRLSLSPFWNGTLERELGDGLVSVDVSNGNRVMVRLVDVTAIYGAGGRALRAEIQLSDYDPPRVISWEPQPYSPPRGIVSEDQDYLY